MHTNFIKGHVLNLIGKYKEAIVEFDKLIDSDPNDLYGFREETLKNKDLALSSLKKSGFLIQ